MTAKWNGRDALVAQSEGWDIFSTDDSDHSPYELCLIACPQEWDFLDYAEPRFDNDPQVWLHVRTKAEAGSAVHQRALAFLAEHSPDEYELVMR